MTRVRLVIGRSPRRRSTQRLRRGGSKISGASRQIAAPIPVGQRSAWSRVECQNLQWNSHAVRWQ